MPKPPEPPAHPDRRHPPARAKTGPSMAIARMRRALVRNRGGDGGDRPDHLARLTAWGLWIGDVDWTKATDAEVLARSEAGEPPHDEQARLRLRAALLQRFAALRAASVPSGPAPIGPDSPSAACETSQPIGAP